MSENMFDDVPREGETVEEFLEKLSPDGDNEVEAPAESSAEKTEAEVLDLQESELKKNARWEEMREELQAEREAREELANKLKEFETRETEQPEFLTDMVGENETVAKNFAKYRQEEREIIKQELIRDQQEAQAKEQEQREHWQKWTQDQFDKVGAKDENTKNELSKIMIDFSPSDDQGNLDYSKGMKILTSLKEANKADDKEKIEVKKAIADATVSRETSTTEKKDYVTSADLRKYGWRG